MFMCKQLLHHQQIQIFPSKMKVKINQLGVASSLDNKTIKKTKHFGFGNVVLWFPAVFSFNIFDL